MTYGSSYEKFFGKYHENGSSETEILKYKKLSELPMSSILNAIALSYLEQWSELKDDDYYVSLVMTCLRNIYTFLKNLKPKVSRNTEAYFWPKRHEMIKQERFDTIEKKVKKDSHRNMYNHKYEEIMKECANTQKTLLKHSQSQRNNIGGVTPAEIRQ